MSYSKMFSAVFFFNVIESVQRVPQEILLARLCERRQK